MHLITYTQNHLFNIVLVDDTLTCNNLFSTVSTDESYLKSLISNFENKYSLTCSHLFEHPELDLFKNLDKTADHYKEVALHYFIQYGVSGKDIELFKNYPESTKYISEYSKLVKDASETLQTKVSHTSRKIFSDTGEVDDSIFQSGVIVDLKIGRWRGQTTLSSLDLGLSKTKEDDAELVDLGKKYLMPKSILKELDSIENRARSLLKKFSISCPWGNFVPTHLFHEWFGKNQEIKLDYLNKKNELIANFDTYLKEVIEKYTDYSEIVYKREKAFNLDLPYAMDSNWKHSYISSIRNKIPDKKAIDASFLYEINYLSIPTTLLDASVQSLVVSERSAQDFYNQLFTSLVSDLVNELIEIKETPTKNIVNKDGTLNASVVKKLHKCCDTFLSKRYAEDTRPETIILVNNCKECLNIDTSSKVSIFTRVVKTCLEASLKLA